MVRFRERDGLHGPERLRPVGLPEPRGHLSDECLNSGIRFEPPPPGERGDPLELGRVLYYVLRGIERERERA